MSAQPPSEEELRAAYEAELARITTAEVIVQTVVSLINLGGRRLGLAPGGEAERDLEQVRDAIDAVRGLMPVLERHGLREIGAIRDALAQLQREWARLAGPAAAGQTPGPAEPQAPPAPEPPEPGTPGPAQSSGRLWVPGQ